MSAPNRSQPVAAPAPQSAAPLGRPAREASVPRSTLGRVLARARLVRRYGCPFFSTFVKDTDNAVTVFLTTAGRDVVGKFFARTDRAGAAFSAERRSDELFGGMPWRMPVLRWTKRGFLVPRLPDDARLDVRAASMSWEERRAMGAWALEVLLDIYLSGHLHGDLQPHNVWYLDGRPVVTDFETFGPRTPGVPFLRSGDIIGIDPGRAERLDPAFDPDDEWSFHHTLGVSLDQAVTAARERLLAASTPESRRRLDALEGRVT